MTTSKISKKSQRAVAKYGLAVCKDAFRRHDKEGSGASTVGFELGLTTQQADAAINAGRELAGQAKLEEDDDWSDMKGGEDGYAYRDRAPRYDDPPTGDYPDDRDN